MTESLLKTCAAILAVVALATSAVLCAKNAEAQEAPVPSLQTVLKEYDELQEKYSVNNAAIHYLVAALQLPDTDDDKLDDFLRGPLLDASPEIIYEMPGAVGAVTGCKESVTKHFHRGAQMERCTFDLNWSAGLGMLLPHLSRVRDLARKAAAYGKFLEAEKRPAEAAVVYLDILRMGCHLDQDPIVISQLVGIAVINIGADRVEGLLASSIDAKTTRFLFEELDEIPDRPFNVSRSFDVERLMCLRALPGYVKKVAARDATAKEQLRTLTEMGVIPDRFGPAAMKEAARNIERQSEEFFAGYNRLMKDLSAAVSGPYHEGTDRVKRVLRQEAEFIRSLKEKGNIFETFCACNSLARIQLCVTEVEARLAALKLLAAASIEKAETDHYPSSLAGMQKHFPRGLPVDPFTGKDFVYRIEHGLPAVEWGGDDLKEKARTPERYIAGLWRARRRREKALVGWRIETGHLPRRPAEQF